MTTKPNAEREVCRCGHLATLHLSGFAACQLRMRLDSPRGSYRPDTHRIGPVFCNCQHFRRARWTDEHILWRHAIVTLWWWLSDRPRWAVCHWYSKLRPGLCWHDIVDAALDARVDIRSDWDKCDAPLPWNASKPNARCIGYYHDPADFGPAPTFAPLTREDHS